MINYYYLGFLSLFLFFSVQVTAQSSDSTSYYDKSGQLDYIHFAIKSKPGLNTKYGRLLHREIETNFGKNFDVILTKENGDKEIIWGPKVGYEHDSYEGIVRNFILEKNYFSAVLTTRGIKWIICERQENGKWKETFRAFIEERGGIGGLNRHLTILMPDKETVTIEIDGGLFPLVDDIESTKSIYRLAPNMKVSKNGEVQKLRMNEIVRKAREFKKSKLKKNEERNK